MPQITVEYSEVLAAHLDRRAFGLELNPLASGIIGSPVSSFKTRFYPVAEAVIGDGSAANAMFHVHMAILSGRDAATKDELGRQVLALMHRHLPAVPGLSVQFTVEIRDMDRAHYQKDVVEG